MPLLGYFITFHTYGTWLHGHAEGSVDARHNIPGMAFLPPSPSRENLEQASLSQARVELDAERRYVVDVTLRDVCRYRRWALHALHVRSTHVHVVVSARHTPERVMVDLKAYGTRRLREAAVLGQDVEPWAEHGSTRYLNTEDSLARAIQYTLAEQGERLEMRCPEGWAGPGSVIERRATER